MLGLVLAGIGVALLTVIVATNRGRSVLVWPPLCLLFPPLLLVLLTLPSRAAACPRCEELVCVDAPACELCGHHLPKPDGPGREARARAWLGAAAALLVTLGLAGAYAMLRSPLAGTPPLVPARASATAADEAAGAWRIWTERSPVTGTADVYLRSESPDIVTDIIGRRVRPGLVLRCADGRTSLAIEWGRYIMTPVASVALRIDAGPAAVQPMRTMPDHKATAMPDGEESVRLVRRLLEADELEARVSPFGADPLAVRFPVAGLGDRLGRFRDACDW